jgi:hypothetical protein
MIVTKHCVGPYESVGELAQLMFASSDAIGVPLRRNGLAFDTGLIAITASQDRSTLRSHSGSSLHVVIEPQLRSQHFTSPALPLH